MLEKLQAICGKYEELCAKSEQPDFYADPKKAAKLLREKNDLQPCLLYTSPSPRDAPLSRMPSSA